MDNGEYPKKADHSVGDAFSYRQGILWMLLAVAVGAGIRGYYLSQPMRYDEAFSFLNFVHKDFPALFFYPLPNNHVLHSILVKAVTQVWGDSPASIRFTAFLAGVATIPLLFCLCRRLGKSGILASFSAAVFPYLIAYSDNARGYSLIVLFSLALAFTGVKAVKKPSLTGAALLSLIAALGMMTIPTMLFPIAGIYCWLGCLLLADDKPVGTTLVRFVIPCLLLTIVLTVILYIPVILLNGIEPLVANRFVQPQPWHQFLGQIYPHLQETWTDFSRDIPPWLVFVLLAFGVTGLYDSARRMDWPTLLILPSMLVGAATVLLIQHKIPFPRIWIYIIPFFLFIADAGFTSLIKYISERSLLVTNTAILATGVACALSLIASDSIAGYNDTGRFAEAPLVAKYLKPKISAADDLQVMPPANWPTYFYLWYYGVLGQHRPVSQKPGITYFVVKKSRYSISDMTDRPVIKLLDHDDMALYQTTGETR